MRLAVVESDVTDSPEKTIEFLCKLVSDTSVALFNQQEPHDCICEAGRIRASLFGYQMNSTVLGFIKQAVIDALIAEGRSVP